ncbi:MAG: DNA-binding transcription factor yap1 [Sclerophora amabilis]|nr:MAG: DNA-binding transcription factor yap1 [Sclerophora amabilis]
MATFSNNSTSLPDPYLSPDQRDLLLAALSSNKAEPNSASATNPQTGQGAPLNNERPGLSNGRPSSQIYGNLSAHKNMSQYTSSPVQYDTPAKSHNSNPVLESPFLDYDLDLDFDESFDSENGTMIGNLPDGSPDEEHDLHDKRKSIDGEDDEGGGKRREGDDKVARKPGRKPLTSEPTSKRKAQNRAAQRAFRERKEKHLKDLEVKVDDLEKASEAANHENGLLRAQVDRLHNELAGYRKRMSLNNTGLPRSPPTARTNGSGLNDSNNFKFDFPKFGSAPGSSTSTSGERAEPKNGKGVVFPGTGNTKSNSMPGVLDNNNNNYQQDVSPGSKNPATSGLSHNDDLSAKEGIEGLEGLFSPSILDSVNRSPSSDYMNRGQGGTSVTHSHRGGSESSNGQGLTPQSQGGMSLTTTTSPSASSGSHHGPTSSCGTSPEPSHQSPRINKQSESSLNPISEDSQAQAAFYEYGNLNDSNLATTWPTTGDSINEQKNPAGDITGIDWLAQQNGGQFDPVLFGDYRDSQDAFASADFGSFFNEAYPLPDLGSPFGDTNTLAPLPKKDILQEMDAKINGDDEVAPSEDSSNMLNCTKMWERLQSSDSFKNGEIDMDNLCSELKKKARCSETGVVVEHDDLEKVLAGLPGNQGQK